ncbi:alpha-2-macroglobulin family protein [Roseivirga seohaensis]|uniref:alpha-2-macroglobulin family protein n=1 Tax=Roseivirga seohaensis TaxID=1914963 RepID=UPI003BAA3F69
MSLSKTSLLGALLCLLFVASCSDKKTPIDQLNKQADQAFSAYISSYTSGKVSTRSTIMVRLVEPVTDAQLKTDPTSLFQFTPNISGKGRWVGNNVVEFQPSSPLKPGTLYNGTLKLSSLKEVEKELNNFNFGFETVSQNFDLEIEQIASDSEDAMRKQVIEGQFNTADFADSAAVVKAVSFKQSGSNLSVQWEIDKTNGTTHRFKVQGVERKEQASEVEVTVDGGSLGVDRDSRTVVPVAVLGDFEVLDVKVVKTGDPYVLVSFSDPLKEDQDLTGLITVEGQDNLRYTIDGNNVRVYVAPDISGIKMVRSFPGIRNLMDFRMKKLSQNSVSFEQLKPSLKLNAKGTILPSTDGLILPFEAVNLNAVDVTVIKIFERNVLQFLQVNEFDGNQQLRRVGKPVLQKRIPLNESGVFDLGKWNRFTLDLNELIQTEPGAIYQVRINFKRAYSTFGCAAPADETPVLTGQIPEDNWDAYSGDNDGEYDSYYDYNYGRNYNWQDRDNPCTDSYYVGNNRMVSKNILASDLGMIAKIGNNRKLTAFVTDLKTTKPISGVSVDVYDFQEEKITTVTTDGQGKIETDLLRKPFLLVANRGAERGYLKLSDGLSLSMSNFNTGGARVERGLKGFMYGERGVWRPGDDIYLNFILEDKEDNLPDDHPVVFELIDPSGNTKQRIVRTQSVDGFYDFKTQTADTDPTGNWTAKVSLGGAEFTKRVKVETVKPNRLKIDLDFGVDRLTAATTFVSGDLNVKWLTGAAARNLKAEFDLYLNPVATTFKNFPNYSFDDEAKNFNQQPTQVFSGEVDASGHSKVNLKIGSELNSPGAVMATFKGKVYEPGGDFSIDQFSIPFYPYTSFVGVKKPEGDRRGQLVTGKSHQMSVVTVDSEGKTIDRKGLTFEVYKLGWRWWWDGGQNDIANYVGANYNKPVMTKTVNTTGGKATVDVNIGDREWGRYYIRVTDPVSKHSTGTIAYFDWPGWADDNNRPGGASLLAFSTDKEDYNIGEKVKINIPSNSEGRALVSVENGSKVVASYWVETGKGETAFEFATTEEMVPNAYVNTTLLQPHAQTRNDLPIRLYGVVPINVSNPKTKLNPEISLPDVLEPESDVTVKVSEKDGRAMTYTIAVVDEGLLDITRFGTPDPWSNFYARQALGVKTWDLFDDVTNAYNGELTRLLALGGDGSNAKPESAKANRFKPVVKHLGPFRLEAGKTASHTFKMPNYVGSVRTMVVAGKDGAYGKAEKATPVRKPLMVLGTLPRVIGPGEKVKLPVSVFAMEPSVKEVKVSVKGNALLKTMGSAQQTLTFNEIGDQIIDFELEVSETLGIGTVEIVATSGNETATYKVEIDVRSPNPPATDVIAKALQAGESWNQPFEQMGMAGTNKVRLELSVIPPINLGKRLNYLISYPHGCIEQTTSAVFPQLFLGDIMELTADRKAEIERNIKAAIDGMSKFQTSEGGFSYWPGQSDDNDWGTNYAGHFLMEAKDKGYNIPSNLLRNWTKFQSRKAKNWMRHGRYNDDLMQAYRLYTLALAQSPELGAMNRLREDNGLSLEAKWRLAAAYAVAGKVNVAKELIASEPKVSKAKSNYYYYGSQTRDNAMILETLGLLKMQNEGMTLLRTVADDLSDDRWMSTQTTAYSLLSVIKFSGVDKTSKGLEAAYVLNSGASQSIETAKPVKLIDVPVDGAKAGAVKVENKGEGVLFARVIKTGQPLAGNETAASNGLTVKVTYVDRNGQSVEPSSLSQGTDFFAEVSVFNPGTRGVYENLALSQVFPSGWEILNERLNEIPGAATSQNYTYQDIRDDRVYTYFDLKPNERKRFKVALNATYAGRFYLPAVGVQAMYDNTINARVPGEWVEVKRVN